ncbi:MAG TPA: hypothetical protein VIQ77_09205 [Mucilaginibacter sp.]|jgi:hypothetical protein
MKLHDKKSGDGNNKHRNTHEADAEGTGYALKSEQEQHNKGNEASYSEQNDVTPPNHKDFPVVGPGKADFESRPQGRRTARMVGHEPGTEGI